MKLLVLVLVLASCAKSSGSAAAQEGSEASASTIVADMRTRLTAKDFYFAVAAFDEANPDDTKAIATQIAPQILSQWDAVRDRELENSRSLGIDRARGKSRNNCVRCERFRGLLDRLAPHAAELAAKWDALKPELERAEAAAYDAEANDPRPKVLVRAGGEAAVLVLECAIEQLRTTFPTYKWIEDYATSGSDPNAPAISILATKDVASYANSHTREEMKLMSGMQVALVGNRHLDKTLAKKFAAPMAANHDVHSPQQIKGVAGPPEAEAVKVGMRQIGELREKLCDELTQQIAANP